MKNVRPQPGEPYVFANAATQAGDRLAALAHILDPGTIRQLQARAIGVGASCLEIGAGAGSIARWLAEHVGADGYVLATDVDTRHLGVLSLPNVEVLAHDISRDPLPEAKFDLVHARLVLEHVSARSGALAQIAAALKPGGWVVIEDLGDPSVVLERTPKTIGAMRQVLREAAVDLSFGRSLGERLRALHLEEVDMEGRSFVWRGGDAGTRFLRLNCEQLRAPILATGLVSPEEFAADLSCLAHSDFELTSPTVWTAWGRRRA